MIRFFGVDFVIVPETLDEQSRTPPISGIKTLRPTSDGATERAWKI